MSTRGCLPEPEPSMLSPFRSQKVLVPMLLLAAVLRLGLAVALKPEPIWPDGKRYNAIAEHILTKGHFPVFGHRSAPLHPLVITGVYAIFGHNGTVARVFFGILGTLTCWLAYILTRDLFGRSSGVVAMALLSVYPLHVYLSASYEYPQALFAFLLTGLMLVLVRLQADPSGWSRWVLGGLLLALAALAIPTILTAAPLIGLLLWYQGRKRWLVRAGKVAGMGATCLLVVLCWSWHWYQVSGQKQLIGGQGPEALWKGNCALAWDPRKSDVADLYTQHGVPQEKREAFEEFISVNEEAKSFPPGQQRNAVYLRAVKQRFAEHPGEQAALLGYKALMFWFPYALTTTNPWTDSIFTIFTQVLQAATFLPILLLALWSTLKARRAMGARLVIFHIVIVTQWLTYTALMVSARYRSNIDVLLIALASPVVVSLGQRFCRRRRKANRHDSNVPAATQKTAV
mgnify:CR=1 FL=1